MLALYKIGSIYRIKCDNFIAKPLFLLPITSSKKNSFVHGLRFKSDNTEHIHTGENMESVDQNNKSGRKIGGIRSLSHSSKSVTNDASTKVPLVALQSPIFPKFNHWVSISNDTLSQAVADAYHKGPQLVACFSQREINEQSHVSDLKKIYHIGTLARISKYVSLTSKDTRMVVSGIRRVQLTPKFLKEHGVEFHKKTPEFDKYPNYIHDNSTNFDHKNPSIKDIIKRTHIKDNKPSEPNISNVISYAWITEYDTHMNACDDARATVLANDIVNCLKEVIGLSNPPFTIQTELSINGKYTLEDYVAIADTVSFIRYRPHFLQDIIEEPDIVSRLERAHYMLKRELEITKISYDITKQTNENIYRVGRRNYLMEQLRAIQKELGITGDSAGSSQSGEPFSTRKRHPAEKYSERMANLDPPEYVLTIFNEELDKIRTMDSSHSEFQSTCNYLDAITSIPWGKYSSSNTNLKEARSILDEDHYGICEVKDLIIEYMAVSNQSEKCRGKILCLAGPPGVGKTSIVKSIARCLNKDYVRVSVGGMDDVAEIKGHRRTYLGSMPGRIISCLKKSKTMNPVILLDEIDKMSRTYKGDPSAALLEALDPEQNVNFLDHFLDFPVDLSKCLFIGTANDLSAIQKPLLDRMEIIEINSYVNEEKFNIAKRHLIPDTINYFGVDPKNIIIDDNCINTMIDDYSREPGMRTLKKTIEKIYRKASTKIQQGEQPPIYITSDNLSKYIGAPLFYKEKYFDQVPVGVVPGLSYNGLGGRVLYIESICLPKSEKKDLKSADSTSKNTSSLKPNEEIIITGHLGDVMKESCQIAKSVAVSYLHQLDPGNDYFSVSRIHCHFPDGSPPKDGPSAGIAITTSFISLAIGTPIRNDLAMTGEICLSKYVLPVGGLAEKLLSAIRNGFQYVIVPLQNKKDIDELNKIITEKLTIFYANTYDDVFKIAFPNYVKKKKENSMDINVDRTSL